MPEVSRWFDPADPQGRLVGAKVLLLSLTVAFALDARLRLIPRLDGTRSARPAPST